VFDNQAIAAAIRVFYVYYFATWMWSRVSASPIASASSAGRPIAA